VFAKRHSGPRHRRRECQQEVCTETTILAKHSGDAKF
jgi:hypothetical protein